MNKFESIGIAKEIMDMVTHDLGMQNRYENVNYPKSHLEKIGDESFKFFLAFPDKLRHDFLSSIAVGNEADHNHASERGLREAIGDFHEFACREMRPV